VTTTPNSQAGEAALSNPTDRVLVIIPTYNESLNLERILTRVHLHNPDVHVLIADDNSPDGTGDIADKLAAADERIQVLHRAGKEGLGAAYLAGFGWGLERGYSILVEMDADGSHRPEDLPLLLAAMQSTGADLVIGSRWIEGGQVVNWPKSREILSRSANIYVRLAMGMKLRDATAGFRAFRRATLEGIGLGRVDSSGYCFQVDLAHRALVNGFTVSEVPIIFVEREVGVSKMSGNIIFEALWRTTLWGMRSRFAKLTGRRDPRL